MYIMASVRKVRVSFADDLVSNRINHIQISSDNSSTIKTPSEPKNERSSGNFSDMLLKRYNIAKGQFTTLAPEATLIGALPESKIALKRDEDFTIDTVGENPDDQCRDGINREIDTELAYISDIPPLDQLLTDLIAKTQNERDEIEASIEDVVSYLNGADSRLGKLDDEIRMATDKLTFLLYMDYTLADIVNLMDVINAEVNHLKNLKKIMINKLCSKARDDDLNVECDEYISKVMKLKGRIGDKYLTSSACDVLVQFHDLYPDDYVRSGLDSHVITILLFYSQLEMLLWDPLIFFPSSSAFLNTGEGDNAGESYIDTNSDITHFTWYKMASKFKSSDSFIRIITQKVYIDSVFDLFKIWEWCTFAHVDRYVSYNFRLVETLKPVYEESQIIDTIEMMMTKLAKVGNPEALENLNIIRSYFRRA